MRKAPRWGSLKVIFMGSTLPVERGMNMTSSCSISSTTGDDPGDCSDWRTSRLCEGPTLGADDAAAGLPNAPFTISRGRRHDRGVVLPYRYGSNGALHAADMRR